MRKVVINKAGGYDRLNVQEFPDPHPSAGEVLIETKACGINFADCCVRMGLYKTAIDTIGWPITPGFEVSGIVKEVGEGVAEFHIGQKVIAITLFNGYTTHLCVPKNQVFPLPDHLSFSEGAAIPTVFLTAYYAMVSLANAKKGDILLVHSAAGGVGSALVQLGKLMGCKVVGVVGSSHKVDYVRDLGCDVVIDKTMHNLWEEAKKAAPEGYDAIFDANGAETLSDGYRHLSTGGRLIVYGFHTMFSKGKGKPNWLKMLWYYIKTPRFNPLTMTYDNKSIMAFNLSSLIPRKGLLDKDFQQLLVWFQQGKIKPPHVREYLFNQVSEAHAALESGETVGKLVLISQDD